MICGSMTDCVNKFCKLLLNSLFNKQLVLILIAFCQLPVASSQQPKVFSLQSKPYSLYP
jgi:hypothetical protein